MEENKINQSNLQNQSKSTSPYLSKRGKYSPSINESNTVVSDSTSQYANLHQAYTNQQSDFNTHPTAAQGKLKHSGLGIASFVISMVAVAIGVISFILIIVAMVNMASMDPNTLMDFQDSDALNSMLLDGDMTSGLGLILVSSLLLFFSCGVAFIGGILGIIAVIQKNRRKVFSVLGLVFNAIVFLGFIILFLLGLLIQ